MSIGDDVPGSTSSNGSRPVDQQLAQARAAAARIRLRAARMIAPHGFGYLGQALSCAELMGTFATAFWRPGRDDFVLSPGHYVIAAYAVGVDLGLVDEAELETYGRDGSRLPAIGTEASPAMDLTCGSLGQALSGAIGLAMANRFAGRDVNTYVLMSDGELQEGQVWEAAMFAAHHNLGRLVVLLDLNNSQVDGPVDQITTIEPVGSRWSAFGWDVHDIDGHDVEQVHAALHDAVRSGRPSIIAARTSTRQGVTSLPEDADGHFIKLPAELAVRVIDELEQAEREHRIDA